MIIFGLSGTYQNIIILSTAGIAPFMTWKKFEISKVK
jgi:hypothetical protein